MDNLSVNKRYCSISSARSSPLRFRKNKTLERKKSKERKPKKLYMDNAQILPPKSQIIPSIFQTHLDSNQDFNPKFNLEKTARLCLLDSLRYDPHFMMIKPVEEPSKFVSNFFHGPVSNCLVQKKISNAAYHIIPYSAALLVRHNPNIGLISGNCFHAYFFFYYFVNVVNSVYSSLHFSTLN